MSAVRAPALRSVTFGDLDAGMWGAAWGRAEPFVAVGAITQGNVATRACSIEGAGPEDEWSLAGEGVQLTLSPEGETATYSALQGFDQLCRVQGRFLLDSNEHRVDFLGRRGARPELDLRSLDSLREVSAWFQPLDGLVLTALRPRGAAGHDRDIVSAALFEAHAVAPVADPRLSTTYGAGGLPQRANLELWLEEGEEEQHYPRRVAGETFGAVARSVRDGVDVQAHAFRWHSRAQDGVGVYMLVCPA